MGNEVLQIGEMSLFLMGIVFSILLLFLLAIPFSIRFQFPCWMSHQSLPYDDFVQKVSRYFKRKGYQVLVDEFLISIRSNSSIYQLHYQHIDPLPESNHTVRIHLTQEGFDLSANPKLSVLSGTGIAHIVLELDQLFNPNQDSNICCWGFDENLSPPLQTPFPSFHRSAIRLSPWH